MNPYRKIVEKPIIREGKLIGYWRYAEGGIFNQLTFVGYRWLKRGIK